jgi:hypothetical protein
VRVRRNEVGIARSERRQGRLCDLRRSPLLHVLDDARDCTRLRAVV